MSNVSILKKYPKSKKKSPQTDTRVKNYVSYKNCIEHHRVIIELPSNHHRAKSFFHENLDLEGPSEWWLDGARCQLDETFKIMIFHEKMT